ncbi:PREDICTED: zinc finger protein 583 [Drosophila arizonae]|uniref:Zinc finger protein 583 n=1 Tax=Drosophila arizonae TaxID=7263 RepID=A0ABM1PK64_DROAR|nr:PREDICTED: zinc finger protein 583 [Drosophila arizonae]
MDFVYVMENPLPPSPPPSADISRCEQNARLHSIDPFEILHEVCSSAVAHTHTHTHTNTQAQPHTQALAQTPAQAHAQAHAHAHANTHTHTHTQANSKTNTYEAAESSGAVSVVAHPRYETRRVAMQRKLRDAEKQTATAAAEQQQQQRQHMEQNVLELTPPATPPTPMPPNSPTSSVASSVDLKLRTRRELERNREFVCSLLVAYERSEKLWNPKHPDYKYNAKRSVYNELAAPLQAVFQIPLTGAEVFAVLKELRGRYRRELSKLNSLGDKYKSRLWYFEKMHFLRGVIEAKRAEREAKNESAESEKSCETDSESTTKSAQYREVLSCLIDGFRRQECLWNPQHFDYNSCSKKELYRQISAELLEELNYEMSGEDCYKELQKLRTRYRKELRMVIKHKGLYLPKLWCYDELEFLQKILQEQIFNKISKKKGVVESYRRTKFIDASSISFELQEDQLQFVEIYRNYPALWDVDHPDFRSNAYRTHALGQMLEELNTTFQRTYTTAELEKTLFELRKDFSAQKRKILTNASDCSSISLLHAKLGQFLEPNLGPFRCDVCSELVKTCDQYKVHRAAHDGTQPFICTLCGKGFQMPCNLTVHIRRHRRDFPYACEQCDKRFATSTEVAIHMRTHTGERPYICDLCGKSFKTWSFFDIHRRTHLNQSSFHCPICDKGFYEKNRFTDHMNAHLNIRKHLCTVCGKTFTTYGNLKKHTELHLAVKKYKCGACGKRFAQFASLRWHRKREHTSEQQQQQEEEQQLEQEVAVEVEEQSQQYSPTANV